MMAIKQKRKNVNLQTLILFPLIFISCAKIQINTPSSRFITSEAQGKTLSGSVRLEMQSGTEGTLDFQDEKTDNPLELRNNVTNLGLSLDLGLTQKIDFFLKGNSLAPATYNLKYQIFGPSRKEATKGSHSMAVSLGYGQEYNTELNQDDSIFNDSNDNITAEVEQSLLEASLIYGHRTHEDVLVYTSVQALKHDINFEFESSNSLNGKKLTLNSWVYGLSLGAIRYYKKFYLNLEISAQNTNWTHNDAMTYAFVNLALGYKWD